MESSSQILITAAFCMCVLAISIIILRATVGRRDRDAPAILRRQRIITISDAAVAHHALVKNASGFWNRPAVLFPVAVVTGPRRRRSDNINSAPYGPLWRALRCNLAAGVIHPTRLASLVPLQHAAIGALVADLSAAAAAAGSKGVVVGEYLYAAVFKMVARMCFGDGVDEVQVRAMQRVIQEFVLVVGGSTKQQGSKLVQRWRRWRRSRAPSALRRRQAELFLPLIHARRLQGKPSGFCSHDDDGQIQIVRPYVDSLLELRVPDEDEDNNKLDVRRALTEDEMVSLVSEFLGASTGSVVACVEWALAHLVTRPKIQTRLRRELMGQEIRLLLHRGATPYLLHAVVLESLRMHPPVPLLMRHVRQDHAAATLGIQTPGLPASGGLRAIFVLRDIGRDPKAWTDPDEFRPERFLAGGEGEGVGPLPGPMETTVRMMPFGAGPRYCPGMGLGILQAKCFLAVLVREFEWAEEDERSGSGGGGVDLAERDGVFKVMRKPLRARITRAAKHA